MTPGEYFQTSGMICGHAQTTQPWCHCLSACLYYSCVTSQEMIDESDYLGASDVGQSDLLRLYTKTSD